MVFARRKAAATQIAKNNIIIRSPLQARATSNGFSVSWITLPCATAGMPNVWITQQLTKVAMCCSAALATP